MTPIIQIAGIIDREDALTAVRAGATHLGFPLRLDVHAEDLTEAEAAEIIRALPRTVMPVLITYLNKASQVVELCDLLGCAAVQLHGNIDVNEVQLIKILRPQTRVWKSLVVGENNFDELKQNLAMFQPFVEAFITDTFDPDTGASGATGKKHDWKISKKLAAISEKPVVLAGGLTAENVFDAVVEVQPSGVDAHTGLEDQSGRKDPEKCRQFVAEALRGFAAGGE